ncbi:UNVERIFIED_CONTAM: hypothetical protein NCL1_41345 [Trichonephila clavipes]
MIQKELNIGFAAIYKIIHDELHLEKVAYRWVPHNLTEHQKEQRKYRIGHSHLVRRTEDNSYTIKYLQQILQKGPMLHKDNASSHSAGLTTEFLEQKQIKVIEHPTYSPDLAINEWFEAFNFWEIHLQKCIDTGGDYFEYS